MRCITAIWPAGPPKESAATRAQTLMASPKGTPWAGMSPTRVAVMSLIVASPCLGDEAFVEVVERALPPTRRSHASPHELAQADQPFCSSSRLFSLLCPRLLAQRPDIEILKARNAV